MIGKGKGALAAVTTALANAATAAARQAAFGLGARCDRRRHARGELSPDRRPEITEPRRARPGRPGAGRAGRADRGRALVKRLKDGEPSVRLQAVIALGRIGHAEAIPALLPLVAETDSFLAYSARQAMRRIGDWPAAAQGLDSPDPKVRAGTLLAMEQVYDEAASSRLAEFAVVDQAADRRTCQGDSNIWPRSIARRLRGTASGGGLSRPSRSRRPGRSPGTARRA